MISEKPRADRIDLHGDLFYQLCFLIILKRWYDDNGVLNNVLVNFLLDESIMYNASVLLWK